MAAISKDAHGLDVVHLRSPNGSAATCYLHGAHVTSFRPARGGSAQRAEPASNGVQSSIGAANGDDVLFVSKQAVFAPPKAIRGGIPVCWPQFNDMGDTGSAHGFARNSLFSVSELSAAKVVLTLSDSEQTRKKWPCKFVLTVTVAVSDDNGGTLTQEVKTVNGGSETMRTTQALHAYFSVGDATAVTVGGLEGLAYLDNAENRARKPGSSDALGIQGFTDRIYADAPDTLTVRDPARGRVIVLAKAGFADAVLWNPWVEKAASMGDFGDEEYREMVCVEPANAACYVRGSAVEVPPGGAWTGSLRIHVAAL